jgi:tRNA-specific 2-thiouridylase
MLKPEVKKYAKKLGMKKTAGKKESQDACFAQQGECFSETLRKLFNGGITEGNFITPSGQIIAPHKGIHNYTTGQRKGLGIALGEPAFISKIDPETGDITVTVEQAELYSLRTTVADINWQQPDFAGQHFKCEVQIRYRNKPVRAEIIPAGTDRAEVLFEEPKRAVTPGQGAAFYKDNILLGGGWIEKTG